MAPTLGNWRQVVWPLFWPVFFWNLRGFLRLIQGQMARARRKGVFVYEVTWYGAIHIHWMQPATPARWNTALEGCARRAQRILGRDGAPEAIAADGLAQCARALPRPGGWAAQLKRARFARLRARLALGAFPGPAHIDTS
ncbi:MAG: hypothetical protein AAGH87_00365 [Pseudomonadota bacterium]